MVFRDVSRLAPLLSKARCAEPEGPEATECDKKDSSHFVTVRSFSTDSRWQPQLARRRVARLLISSDSQWLSSPPCPLSLPRCDQRNGKKCRHYSQQPR